MEITHLQTDVKVYLKLSKRECFKLLSGRYVDSEMSNNVYIKIELKEGE